ncbi:sarcosine oxidase subunit alpha family protein [Qingshengfaniella alkalisoli]|uniref:Sarcosine oxidase subunit alpha family protein n=1 Tax=Qingshengfaniella alkalisoli TaxID=2599296 RepID=A0A5B8J1U1_9RHOB|nr:sarcosine oxidase subunit alpha family protein [Qingshengfaniella alkalisoli]QDY70778.1 sarcosine oxidase subunit alpha family protein [Qingshengfaniella alkalisoli]
MSRVNGKGHIGDRVVRFTFDGKTYAGREGDTVASALLANDVHLVGRSFKYHRPRGIVSAGSEEPNALIRTARGAGRAEPNTRATMQEIHDGLQVESQNRWPALGFDLGAVNDFLSPFFPAGFYYKTFMWPRAFWDRVYEPVIRAAAGLGKAPGEPDPDHYAARYLHCDVLIVGAGPAGLAAAREAAEAGADVVLVDEHAELGGSLLSDPSPQIEGASAWAWLGAQRDGLREAGVRVLTRTTAIGYYHQNMVALVERVTDHLASPPTDAPRERLWRVRAGAVVLAQGAIEKPLVFDGNDRPGVMLAGAAQSYLNRFGVLVGRQALVTTSHDSAYFAAFDLMDAGAEIVAICDTRPDVDPTLLAGAEARGIMVLPGAVVTETTGRKRIRSARVNRIMGAELSAPQSFDCDVLLMSGGWTPTLHLFSHTKGSLKWNSNTSAFLPDQSNENCLSAGAATGLWGTGAALDDGASAGAAAAGLARRGITGTGGPDKGVPDAAGTSHRYSVTGDRVCSGTAQGALPNDKAPSRIRAFVDFQNDVTAKDIKLALREGMRSIEHVKRYTTTGMATDQGKLSNMNALMVAAQASGQEPPDIGLTTFRPPYVPTTFGALANHHKADFEVVRRTSIDPWAEAQGAVFENVAQWRRARYFPQAGEDMAAAVARECRMTREAVGLFDASTLGKIEITGPDAVEFMNRVYTNPWTKLGVGRCRYGLLLGEDGFIRDDGVIGRLSQDRFHVTTTTGGAPRVLAMMEDYLQTEWPDLKVWLTSTTEQWAVIAVNGPEAADLIRPFVDGPEITDETFPHMSVAECRFDGIAARLFRLSFTGEVGFEINVPARHGKAVWEALWAAGQALGVVAYGTETMHHLRADKGFIIVGQDTDGTVTPHDAGMGWAIGKSKPDFIGKRSLERPDMKDPYRKQLVGLLTDDPTTLLEEGAQIVDSPNARPAAGRAGHVTSAYRSTVMGRSIALALVSGGHQRMGETVYIPMPDGPVAAKITATTFYDPDNVRVRLEQAE